MTSGPPAPGWGPPAPVRRRRRWPLRLGIVLLVLVILFVAADRIAVAIADRVAADKIASSQGLTSPPDVDINGFPFLTQVASGTYDSIDMTARDVPIGGSSTVFSLDTLDVHLSDVTVSDSFSTVHAASASARGLISFADLARAIGVPSLSMAGPDRLQASVTATVNGQPLPVTISADVHASASDGLTFSKIRIDAGGITLPASAAGIADPFRIAIPLDGIPFQIRVAGLEVTDAGVAITLVGQDLTYSG